MLGFVISGALDGRFTVHRDLGLAGGAGGQRGADCTCLCLSPLLPLLPLLRRPLCPSAAAPRMQPWYWVAFR